MTSQAIASAAGLSQGPQGLPPPMQLNIPAKPPLASTSDWRYIPALLRQTEHRLIFCSELQHPQSEMLVFAFQSSKPLLKASQKDQKLPVMSFKCIWCSLEEDSILENTLAEWWNAPDRYVRAPQSVCICENNKTRPSTLFEHHH